MAFSTSIFIPLSNSYTDKYLEMSYFLIYSRRRKSYYSDAFICADSDVEVLLSDVYKEQYAVKINYYSISSHFSSIRYSLRCYGWYGMMLLNISDCYYLKDYNPNPYVSIF